LASLWFSIRQFRKQNEGKRFREAVRETKDPGSLMVLVEDSAGFVGEGIAAAGVFANTHGFERGDGVASVAIGILLGAMAIFLIAQMRDLVIGEGVEDEISDAIKELAVGPGKFRTVRGAHTMHFGPETVLVTLEAEFDPERKAGELIEAVDQMQKAIRERYPAVKFVYVDPETGN
jgi:divalent metal cation (Fe/Co/Zn/Cd) transporter